MRFARFVFENSLLLLAGTVIALAWANIDAASYSSVADPVRFPVNDIGMALFFAMATKEVYEALLPGGALASPRHAAAPLAAAVGGMLVPGLLFAGLVVTFGPNELMPGWAIPCATDIAFSALVARAVFPAGHPAIPFLLLLAIADDALGLLILAVFYPSRALAPLALVLLMAAAVLCAGWLRRRQATNFWSYLIGPGALSWAALYLGGFHPALALVPVVPFMSHDTLHRFERWWTVPVQFVLLLFGFANAGVPLEQVGAGTGYVLVALLVGKPLGILVFSGVAALFGARLAPELRFSALLVVALAAAIGFTVSLFFATAAFPEGRALAETKMGALLSFVAAPIALVVGRLARNRQQRLSR